MLHTPLHQFHLDHGAQMVEYAGWDMPIRYGSIQDEHTQVRTSGGLFDVSHMGRLELKGLHARRLLDRATTRDITAMQPGMCRYGLVLNERGGIMDDVIVSRMDDDAFSVVVNAANRAKIVKHLSELIAEHSWKVALKDTTEKSAMLAIQGPRVMDLIAGISSEIPTLKRYRFTVKNVLVFSITVSRTGYTGEDGVEVILPSSAVPMALPLVLKQLDFNSPDAPIKPVGLGARDTLRLEAGMPLYGNELTEDTNALATGLGFAIAMDKGSAEKGELSERFIGQDVLEETMASGGPDTKLVGLKIEGKRTPRTGMPVLMGDEPVGTVTSGCQSPTLGHPIAMAYMPTDRAADGTTVQIDAGRARLDAAICPLPFYKAPKKG